MRLEDVQVGLRVRIVSSWLRGRTGTVIGVLGDGGAPIQVRLDGWKKRHLRLFHDELEPMDQGEEAMD